MSKKSANERTFQGILFNLVSKILETETNIKFDKITQEENIGKGNTRFADGLLYSKIDSAKKILFELKNSSWDATNEILVSDAANKAYNQGFEYFVTGTPRQLVIYKTFMQGVALTDRKLKSYIISNVKQDDDVLTDKYESQIKSELIKFLTDLSNLVHGIKEVYWDSIDRFFVVKLSMFILEASANTVDEMYDKIEKDNNFKTKLKDYLREQDIFGVTLSFNYEDVYKISQLANYLLYLKIIFYNYIQRDVPTLNLKPLTIPIDKIRLNKTLRERFNDVLTWDYQSIFQENVLDEFEFKEKFIPEFSRQVEEFKKLDFKQLNADIIGSIYNTLIDNQEQHDRGQHFTNINEVDLVSAFCIDKDTEFIIDTGCGAGTFLVRAYFFLKYFNPKLTHEELLERIWGVEIAPFPVFLASMNLSLLDVKSIENYPIILNHDFSELSGKAYYRFNFANKSKKYSIKNLQGQEADVLIPEFDVCVGNPPYIRQELIANKEEWNKLALNEWGLEKINQQSDLYVYYLMHTASFLKNGKRLGYVISSSWLDVSFGKGFQKFLLDNFKIIAIIDNQKIRSFDTASVNTVILILEKCNDKTEREQNNIKFVRIYADYDALIGKNDDKDRAQNVIKFVRLIEHSKKTIQDKNYYIIAKKQHELESETTVEGKYFNGHWGALYLRSPEIFTKIIGTAKDKLIPLRSVVDVKRGFTTGANEFFYVQDVTDEAIAMPDKDYYFYFGTPKSNHIKIWKRFGWYYSDMTESRHIIERQYILPVFKTQKEANNLDVDFSKLKYGVLVCNKDKKKLASLRHKVLNYIETAESKDIHLRASNASRKIWYNIYESAVKGDFIFPSKIGERYRLIDNRVSNVYCDKVNYAITVKEDYKQYSDLLFLVLNSQMFRYFIDLFSRQLTGSQTLSDVDVNIVERTPVINPELLSNYWTDLQQVYKSIKSREQGTIFQETKQADKLKLDTIILKALGLSENDVTELYREAINYVKERQDKSESITTKKTKTKLSYDDSFKFIKDRFGEIKSYKSLLSGIQTKTVKIPDWTAKYPTNINTENLFADYSVYFEKANKQIRLTFENPQQILLFKFLNETLEIKGVQIEIPTAQNDCFLVLNQLVFDYDNNLDFIKKMLKNNRSTANHLSIYRDLIVKEDS